MSDSIPPQPSSPDGDFQSLVKTRDATRIAQMFDAIARKYDLMNRIMTAGQDGRWRRLAADASNVRAGQRALDVATGTGDMAIEIARRVLPNGEVVAVDIAEGMLQIGRAKAANLPVRFEVRDVHDLGFDSEYDAVTVAFGFRNFSDRRRAVESMARTLKPEGRLVILELIPSHTRLKPLIDLYERRLIPLVARLLGADAQAYQYLPQSVAISATAQDIRVLLRSVGLRDVGSRELTLGTVAVVWGTKE